MQSKDVGRVSKVVKFDELTPLRKLLAASEDFSNAGAEGGVPDNATMRGNSDEQRRYCLATNIDRIFFCRFYQITCCCYRIGPESQLMTNPPPHNSITGCECSNYIYVRAFGRTTSRLTGTNEKDSSNSSRTRPPD